MTHVTPAAAGFQMSSRFTKYPTQNLGDSILNSLESLLSKMVSSSPPPHPKPRMLPPPCHFHQYVPPLLLQKSNVFAISTKIPPRTSLIAFYTHVVVYKCFPCPYDSKNMPHGAIRAHLRTVTPHCAESGSAGQTGSPNREPRAPNPEFRAPGSTPTTSAWLWAPCAHLGRLEAAPSPPQGTQNDPPF
jgi:hypothetical protein